jgi:hypothetical protein
LGDFYKWISSIELYKFNNSKIFNPIFVNEKLTI